VHDRAPANVARLLSALADLDAIFDQQRGASKVKDITSCSRAVGRSTYSGVSVSGAAIKT